MIVGEDCVGNGGGDTVRLLKLLNRDEDGPGGLGAGLLAGCADEDGDGSALFEMTVALRRSLSLALAARNRVL